MKTLICNSFYALYKNIADCRNAGITEFAIEADSNAIHLLLMKKAELLNLMMRYCEYKYSVKDNGISVYGIQWPSLNNAREEDDAEANNDGNETQNNNAGLEADEPAVIDCSGDNQNEPNGDQAADKNENSGETGSETYQSVLNDIASALSNALISCEAITEKTIEEGISLDFVSSFGKQLVEDTEGKLPDLFSNLGFCTYRLQYSIPDYKNLRLMKYKLYSGVKVYFAHKAGMVQYLNDRELGMLEKAIFVARICKSDDDRTTAKRIVEWIAQNTVYYTDDDPCNDNDCAIGVILNGRADCDGYSDAFFLIASLAGLTVRLQIVTSLKENSHKSGHMANLIQLNGTWRFIDCTWSDRNITGHEHISEINFDIGCDRARLRYSWDPDCTVPIAEETDLTVRPDNEYLVYDIHDSEKIIEKSISRGQHEIYLQFMRKFPDLDVNYYTGMYAERLHSSVSSIHMIDSNALFLKKI